MLHKFKQDSGRDAPHLVIEKGRISLARESLQNGRRISIDRHSLEKGGKGKISIDLKESSGELVSVRDGESVLQMAMESRCFGTNDDLGMIDTNLVTPAGALTLAVNSPARHQAPSASQVDKAGSGAVVFEQKSQPRANKLLLQPNLYKKTCGSRIVVIGDKTSKAWIGSRAASSLDQSRTTSQGEVSPPRRNPSLQNADLR